MDEKMDEKPTKSGIKLFEQKKIRSLWDADSEQWYVSIVDVVGILTDSANPNNYWKVLKNRLKKEGSELVTNCNQLRMLANDGKKYLTDVATIEQLFRLIQSIPSPRAEPFKLWLAELARERIEEMDDPEIGIERVMEYYHRKGYSESWINQRLKSIEVRKELTDEWKERGVKGSEFATLTDIITRGWSDMTTKQYKQHKGLKSESLRDNMTNLELVLNMLAEATTTEISKEKKPQTVSENRNVVAQGGRIAGNARAEIEIQTGKKVVSTLNAESYLSVDKVITAENETTKTRKNILN